MDFGARQSEEFIDSNDADHACMAAQSLSDARWQTLCTTDKAESSGRPLKKPWFRANGAESCRFAAIKETGIGNSKQAIYRVPREDTA
uniref:hypothetical protein n=1 Tax=Burkholderia cenocepacia TaxID=95486 RepID=UPI00195562D0